MRIKKKEKSFLLIFLLFTKNNIILSANKLNGEILFLTSLGKFKKKNVKKLNSTCLVSAFNDFINRVLRFGYLKVHIKLFGANKCKRFLIKNLKQSPLQIVTFLDSTTKPHNGCRIKKERRL